MDRKSSIESIPDPYIRLIRFSWKRIDFSEKLLDYIIIKNSDQDSGIVNRLIGEYVNHNDIKLQMKLDDNKVIPIQKKKI